MGGSVSPDVQKIESSVASALGSAPGSAPGSALGSALSSGGNAADVVRREVQCGTTPATVALGALYGLYTHLKSALVAERGDRLPQTETFRLVDHWGRLTALTNLLTEIEAATETESDQERGRREVFWRGVIDCCLNLSRDTAAFIGLAGCAPLGDAILGVARDEAGSLRGAIHRVVARE